MDKKLLPWAEQYAKGYRRRRIWRRAVRLMACAVVFCTTYALILPAVTMERSACTLEEHTHSDSCYGETALQQVTHLVCSYESLGVHVHTAECRDEQNMLVCGCADFVIHVHEVSCWDESGALVCQLPEVREHQHTAGCFQTAETEAAEQSHVHDASCYTVQPGELTCELPETEEHVHTESCYEEITQLTCGVEEGIAETEPGEPELICGKTERKLHTHTDTCFENWVDETGAEQKRLICTELALEAHVHSEACFVTEEVPLEDTRELICGMEEHVHDEECTPIPDPSEEEQVVVETQIEVLATQDTLLAALQETYDASAREDDISVVAGDGITFALFDYSNFINRTGESAAAAWRAIQPYFNFRDARETTGSYTDNSQNSSHDKDGFTRAHATVERKLDSSRNPVLDLTRNADGTARTDPGVSAEVRSLAYLFSDQGDHAVTAYRPSNTILQKAGNHYWYDSRDNAVDYDISSGLFRVRSYAERNDTTAGYSGYSDFLPFTYTGGEAVGTNTATSVDYHVEYADVNYWFGMTMDINFFQTKDGQIDGGDMVFRFSGDDDVWVFVDDVLVLDLGGTHGTATGSINFATGEVVQYLSWNGGSASNTTGEGATSFPTTIRACFDAAGATPNGGWGSSGETFADYTEHTLKFFYMERGAAVANCKLDFRLPTLPEKSLTVTKDLTADGDGEVGDFLADTLLYQFRVVKADEEGNATGELFIKPGTAYTILDGGAASGTGTVDAEGCFYLKAGQSAQFTDMLVKGGGAVEYIVQEIMPDSLTGQYGGVEYEVSGNGGSVEKETGAVEDFATFSTGVLSAESTQTVTFRNKVDTSALSILKLTKQLAPSAEFAEGTKFQIQVTLGGHLLPVGTQYQIGTEVRTVTEAGIVELEIGQTATILKGILSGTEYQITELGAESGGFTPAYSGTVTCQDDTVGTVDCTADGASGRFPLNSLVHVTVTNANYDFAGQIPIYKQALDNASTATFRFWVEQVVLADDGSWTVLQSLPGTSITLSDAQEHGGIITIGYQADTSGTFYYRITEQPGTGDYIYDDSFYIVEMNVTSGGDASIGSILKNGTEPAEKVLFTNRKTTNLIVTKEVTGAISNGTFGFEASVTLNGEPFALPAPAEGAGYTVSGSTAFFDLANGGAVSISGIPCNAVVVVTETRHEGFTAYCRVEGVDTENVLSDSATVTFGSGTRTVHFVNDGGYTLPETGGAGTYLYTMGGWLLAAAAVLLYIHAKRPGKEEWSSF